MQAVPDPSTAYVPAGQLRQVVPGDTLSMKYVPAPQQTPLPTPAVEQCRLGVGSEQLVGAQEEHVTQVSVVIPIPVEYFPGVHNAHELNPDPVENCPAVHCVQAMVPAVELEPASHAM